MLTDALPSAHKLKADNNTTTKNPIFDSLVKNFAQNAYVTNADNGLRLEPNVRLNLLENKCSLMRAIMRRAKHRKLLMMRVILKSQS
jgi:hypothetical protein